MADRQSIVDALMGTWPVRMGQAMLQGAMAPGEAWQGNLGPAGSRETTENMVGPATDLAGLAMGTAPFAPPMRNAVGAGIRAYHGSPYDFDKFDISKIGTGEGAQVYGHGLYFAENEAVAKSYRDSLAASGATLGGKSVRDLAAEKYRLGIAQSPTAEQDIADFISSYQNNARFMMEKRRPDLLPIYDNLKKSGAITDAGKMYEVNINAEPHQFLDWDKPLAQQGAEPLKVLDNIWGLPTPQTQTNMTGQEAYRTLALSRLEGAKGKGFERVTNALNEAGIPGIKYLDQGSRGTKDWVAHHPQGGTWAMPTEAEANAFIAKNPEYSLEKPSVTSNYVVFNPEIVDILKKYSIPGLMPFGAGAGAIGQLPFGDQQ